MQMGSCGRNELIWWYFEYWNHCFHFCWNIWDIDAVRWFLSNMVSCDKHSKISITMLCFYPAADEEKLQQLLERVFRLSQLEKRREPLEVQDHLTAVRRQVKTSRTSIQAQRTTNTRSKMHKREDVVCYTIVVAFFYEIQWGTGI